MRASPPYLCRVARFGVWRGAVAFVVLADVGVMLGWAMSRDEPLSLSGIAVLGLVAIALVGMAVTLVWSRPVVLRWDGRQWWWTAESRRSAPSFDPAAARPCVIDVALDLGSWLMLRVRPAGMSPDRTLWLPVQRRGFGASWHGLRCALYAPPPPDNADVAEAGEPAQ
jgi:hypothetical protein